MTDLFRQADEEEPPAFVQMQLGPARKVAMEDASLDFFFEPIR